MAKSVRDNVPFRRRREGKTDYRARLKLLKSRLIRVVVRKSLKHTVIQMVKYEEKGDKVVSAANTSQLREMGWKGATGNTPAAYLAGLLAGRRALKVNIKKAVLDLGLQRPSKGSRVFASLKGVVDAGVEVPHSDEVLPDETRIRGEHLKKPEMTKQFDELKQKILIS